MEGILLNPKLQLLIQAVAPAAATPLRIDGLWMRDGKPSFFSNDITVPAYIGNVTQFAVPAYSDHLISLSCHIPAAVGVQQGVFVEISIIHGNINNLRKVATLGSGWVYDTNPIGFPISNRLDDPKILAPTLSIVSAPLAGTEAIYTPQVGLNCELVGFIGTLTCSGVGANRTVGLETLDYLGNTIIRNFNTTPLIPLSISTLYYSGTVPIDLTIGTDLYVGGQNVLARDPMQFKTITNNLDIADQWANVLFFVRPNVIL